MSVSRREQSTPEKFEIVIWMRKFIIEFKARFTLPEDSIKLDVIKNNILVRFDPSQLSQVIWNLCENALRYSQGTPMLTLVCGISNETQRPYIDIIDYGHGITDTIKAQLFEPFFTTEVKGSGLGLYLARELCEANQASLSLHSTSEEGTTFRLSFMHLSKQNDLI